MVENVTDNKRKWLIKKIREMKDEIEDLTKKYIENLNYRDEIELKKI
jgi:hypothetical protein